MRDAVAQTVFDLAARDPRTMIVTADLGYGVWDRFQTCLPNQFVNVGVAEQNMIGVASGLALSGFKVFTYSITPFAVFRCFEQIRNLPYFHQLDVKFLSMGGGFDYGVQGYSHHGVEDFSLMRALAGMPVLSPSDQAEARYLTEYIHGQRGPAYLRLERNSAAALSDVAPLFSKARLLRPGREVVLVCIGGISASVLELSGELAGEGIDCGVLQFHSLHPFDGEALHNTARGAQAVITIEEHSVSGGLGSRCAEHLIGIQGDIGRFFRLGVHELRPDAVGDRPFLLQLHGLDKEALARFIRRIVRH